MLAVLSTYNSFVDFIAFLDNGMVMLKSDVDGELQYKLDDDKSFSPCKCSSFISVYT